MSATLLAVVAVLAGLAALARRRRPAPPDDEPWRRSLEQDDEPLDLDEIRRAEEEFLADGFDAGDLDDLPDDDGEPWRSH